MSCETKRSMILLWYFCRLTAILAVTWMWCFLALREDSEGGQLRDLGQDGFTLHWTPQLLLTPNTLQTPYEQQDNFFLSAPLLLPAWEAVYQGSTGCMQIVEGSHFTTWHIKAENKEVRNIITMELFWTSSEIKTKPGAFSAWQAFSSASRKEKHESTG